MKSDNQPCHGCKHQLRGVWPWPSCQHQSLQAFRNQIAPNLCPGYQFKGFYGDRK